jgi:thiamine pyrophosphate-dependent acetolactate synthase large subunit-like protein
VNGSEAIAKILQAEGIPFVSAYPGGARALDVITKLEWSSQTSGPQLK